MTFKLTGIDAGGQHHAITVTGAGGLRILTDRIHIGDAMFLRDMTAWGHTNGRPPKFVEIQVEEEREERAAPKQEAPKLEKPAEPAKPASVKR